MTTTTTHRPRRHRIARAALPWLAAAACLGGVTAALPARAAPSVTDREAAMDPAVRPQDDLYRAYNGAWLASAEIPADKASYGAFVHLRDGADAAVRSIVEGLATARPAPGSIEHKVGSYYGAYVDTATIDRAGLAPLQPLLAELQAIRNLRELARWQGRQQGLLETPIVLEVMPDFKQPGINRALTWQGGLGMPDRDYYLDTDDAGMAKVRSAYTDYLATLARLGGDRQPEVTAARVLALETRIARLHRSQVDNRDMTRIYNPSTLAELARSAPGFDWAAYFDAAGLGRVDRFSVSQPDTTTGIARLYGELPLADWKTYFRLRVLDAHAQVLPAAFREARFAFRGRAVTGTTSEKPRWQQAITELNNAMGEAVGRVYVARHFPAANKARMVELVDQLLAAYRESIDTLAWMSPATRAQAQAKLARYQVKIGYPDRWRNFDKLVVRPGDAAGNLRRARAFEWQRAVAKAGQPVDRTEWEMTPQTVNAYYHPMRNEIVFPAAILQPPFFDMAADDATNYGAIGAIIGHEISHGFDDQGSRFDGDGALRDWWTEADRQAFDAASAALVAQYDAYEALPGKKVNGKLTLGENIADLSGLQVAFKAWQRSLQGRPAPVVDGRSGAQRFFMGWAQAWRDKQREQRALQLLTVDPHSPDEFRANGAAVNSDAYHEAYGTQPGDRMYKAPDQRIRIW
ncbi:MAG: hypothetical protein RLZZ584_3032 [Pseudomonadota bacterium]